MKPTKRHTDPLGRSALFSRYRLHALCLAVAILGSAWPIWPRSIKAAFDTWRARARAAPVDKAARNRAERSVGFGSGAPNRENENAPDKELSRRVWANYHPPPGGRHV